MGIGGRGGIWPMIPRWSGRDCYREWEAQEVTHYNGLGSTNDRKFIRMKEIQRYDTNWKFIKVVCIKRSGLREIDVYMYESICSFDSILICRHGLCLCDHWCDNVFYVLDVSIFKNTRLFSNQSDGFRLRALHRVFPMVTPSHPPTQVHFTCWRKRYGTHDCLRIAIWL